MIDVHDAGQLAPPRPNADKPGFGVAVESPLITRDTGRVQGLQVICLQFIQACIPVEVKRLQQQHTHRTYRTS